MLSKNGVGFLKAVAEYCVNHSGYDSILKSIRITGGGNGSCTAEFVVAKEHLNSFGSLHSGCTATIIDNITTYALMSADSHPGVTAGLRINYLKGAREGEEIIIDAHTRKVGKTMAFIDCILKNKSDGSIVAKGGQTKYVGLKH